MTLDEAIEHAEDVAEINDNIAYNTDSENWMDIAQCQKCAEEHRQLAEWLKELKKYRQAWRNVINGVVEQTQQFGKNSKFEKYEMGMSKAYLFVLEQFKDL